MTELNQVSPSRKPAGIDSRMAAMILDGLLHFAILCAAAMGALYSIEIFGGKPEAVASGLVVGAVVLGLIVITFSTYLRQQHNMTDDLGHEPVNNAPLGR